MGSEDEIVEPVGEYPEIPPMSLRSWTAGAVDFIAYYPVPFPQLTQENFL